MKNMNSNWTPEITGITLLSIKEAKALPKEIRLFDGWWWLRSPGYDDSSAAGVYNVGSVDYSGDDVDYARNCVRPALKITNLDSSDLKMYEKVRIFDLSWTVIGEDMVLCDTAIAERYFREDWEASDANDYEASDVKVYLEDWLKNAMTPKRVFTPGDRYSYTSWFTGAWHTLTVSSRTEDKVCFKAVYDEADGVHTLTDEYDIHISEEGHEYIIVQSYKGEEHHLVAKPQREEAA